MTDADRPSPWDLMQQFDSARFGPDIFRPRAAGALVARDDGVLDSGFLRFWGTAELHEAGPVHDAIFARLSKREQEHVGADTGIGVLIRLTRAADVRGPPIL